MGTSQPNVVRHQLKSVTRYLLYATTLTPAIVSGAFLFPYIAPRTVFFRLLIELATLTTVWLAIRYRTQIATQYQGLLYLFAAFIGVNVISSFISLAPLVAWFSDTERMWGVWTLIHLFLLFILLRIHFTGAQWQHFFNIALAVSIYISGYALLQRFPDVFGVAVLQAGDSRTFATLGNPAYLAIYSIFSAGVAFFLLRRTTNWRWRSFYVVALIFNTTAFMLTNVLGTAIGVGVGLFLAMIGYLLLGHSKRGKVIITVLLLMSVVCGYIIQLQAEASWVQESLLLRRVVNTNLMSDTVQTRLVGWRAAWQGFKEHPLFGVGAENYHTVFNKYFDSNYYLYAPTEPYFDRAHNAWLDVLVMNGIVGFVIFLSLIGTLGWYVARGYRTNRLAVDEILIYSAVLVTYFIHLVFVFDDLSSYSYFVAFAAFITYRASRIPLLTFGEQRSWSMVQQYTLGGIVVVTIGVLTYTLNVNTLLAGKTIIDALQSKDFTEQIHLFEKSLAYDIIPDRNVVLSYVNYLTDLAQQLEQIRANPASLDVYRRNLMNAREALEKTIHKDQYNALLHSRLAALNNVLALTTHEARYLDDALDAINNAIELSPEHLQYYYTLANTYAIAGQHDKAAEAIEQAIAINNQYAPSYEYLARVYVNADRLDAAMGTLREVNVRGFVINQTEVYYTLTGKLTDAGQLIDAISVLELALANSQQHITPETLITLTRLYLQIERLDNAVATLEKISELDDKLTPQVQQLIADIREGKADEVIAQLQGAGN